MEYSAQGNLAEALPLLIYFALSLLLAFLRSKIFWDYHKRGVVNFWAKILLPYPYVWIVEMSSKKRGKKLSDPSVIDKNDFGTYYADRLIRFNVLIFLWPIFLFFVWLGALAQWIILMFFWSWCLTRRVLKWLFAILVVLISQ